MPHPRHRGPKALGIGNLRDQIGLASHSVGPAFAAAAAAAPYLCAIIMLDGRLDFSAAHDQTRMRSDPAVRGIMARVEVVRGGRTTVEGVGLRRDTDDRVLERSSRPREQAAASDFTASSVVATS